MKAPTFTTVLAAALLLFTTSDSFSAITGFNDGNVEVPGGLLTDGDFVEVDLMHRTSARVTLVGGIFPIPTDFLLHGPTEVHVYFEGANEGDALDDDIDGLDEVETELVSMDLTDSNVTLRIRSIAQSPFSPSSGEIEEQVNNITGRLDLDPFHPGDADSFFDVFFELELPNGMLLHNEEPARMEAVISEKPPLARYVFIEPPEGPRQLYTENNEPTGIYLIAGVHYTVPLGSIHGLKYKDVDGNGRFDSATDPRMPGVTFTLTGDVDGNETIDIVTTVSDATGEFDFTGLYPGTYEVEETMPVEWYPVTAPRVTVTVGPGEEIVALPGQAGIIDPNDPRHEVRDLDALARELGWDGPPPGHPGVDLVTVFDTELISMELFGQGPMPLGPGFTDVQSAVEISEAPTLATAGGSAAWDLGGGQYHVDSFFDVFFDVTITDVDPVADYMGHRDGASLTFEGIGPSTTRSVYEGPPPPENQKPSPFDILPPPPTAPYLGFTDVVIPLGDLDGDQHDDYLKFTLMTKQVEGQGRSYIQLPEGQIIDSFDLSADLSGVVTNGLSDPPFTIAGLAGPAQASQQLTALAFGNRPLYGTEAVLSFRYGSIPASSPEGSVRDIQVDLEIFSGELNGDVTVEVYDRGEGTATGGGEDYTYNGAVLTFPAGSTGTVTRTISVPIHDDPLYELAESVALGLRNIQTDLRDTVTWGANQNHLFYIDDDELPPTAVFQTATSATVDESTADHPAEVLLVLDPAVASLGVNVPFFVDSTDVTTTEDVDYVKLLDEVVLFPSGSVHNSTSTLNLPILDDYELEGDETLTLELYEYPSTRPLGGHGPLLDAHTVTITDDDFVEFDYFPETVGQLLVELPPEPGIETLNADLPPTDGVYRSPSSASAEYQGPDLHLVLRDIRHRPLADPPPVITTVGADEHQEFEASMNAIAEVTIISMGLEGELVQMELTGPVQTVVLGKADQTVGSFQAEIVEMTLIGNLMPDMPIIIRESPTQASPGQTTITDLGGGLYHIDSFFDVFTELSVDGGQSWVASSESTRIYVTQPGIVASSSELPPTEGDYTTPEGIEITFEIPGLTLVLGDVRYRPYSYPPPERSDVGADELESFHAGLYGIVTMTAASMGLDGAVAPIELTGPVETLTQDRAISTTGEFQAEIVSMTLSGEVVTPLGPIFPMEIRESVTQPSQGVTTINDRGNGEFPVESFFDVFVEMSVDGGQTWIPGDQSIRMELGKPPRLIPMVGPAEVHVFFEDTQEGIAFDDDSDGLDEVDTELVQLDLQGMTPLGPIQVGVRTDIPSYGEIEEQANNTSGWLDLDPFSPGDADSFFDVWTEITLGGQDLETEEPLHLESVIEDKPPQRGERYVSPLVVRRELINAFTGEGTGMYVLRETHQPAPTTEIDYFPATEAEVILEVPGLGPVVVPLSGPTEVRVYFEGPTEGDAVDDNLNGRDEVPTQMTELQLSGNHPMLGPVFLRPRPGLLTLGLIEEITNDNPGRLDTDPFHPGNSESFFDVFFEIEIPGQGLLLHNEQSALMVATIRHKPPAPGDIYVKVGTPVEMYDENQDPTGILLLEAWHMPVPTEGWDLGDAPATYPVLIASNGARHVIVPGIHLGTGLDDEPDGQPTIDAQGDDLDIDLSNPLPNYDDEDGVTFPTPLMPGYRSYVHVLAATRGVLNAWIDFEGDGNWTAAYDHILVDEPLTAGMNTLAFDVPLVAIPGLEAMARFRFSTVSGLPVDGAAPDGEVEDHTVSIADPGIDPLDWGDAPEPYPTLASHSLGGAVHRMDSWLYLGYGVDSEPDGQPDPAALGDDVDLDPSNPPPNFDDEDGLRYLSVMTPGGSTVQMEVYVTTSVVRPAWLSAFVDWNSDGSWSDPGEQVVVNAPVMNGLNTYSFRAPPGARPGPTYLRLRLSSEPGLPAHGPAEDGEVEDYLVTIYPEEFIPTDYGDAPLPYATLDSDGGAMHGIMPGMYLGAGVDGEHDGQPDIGAEGDDLDSGAGNPAPNYDDEDGVLFTSPLVMGKLAHIEVRCGPTPGLLDAWIDYDGSTTWDPGEHLFGGASLWLSPGVTSNIAFQVPWPCVAGPTYARFRFSGFGGLPPTGPVENGEVEDYRVIIRQPAVTPEDEDLWITDITLIPPTNGTARITWLSVSNRVYQLEKTDHLLPPPAWSNAGPQVTGPDDSQDDSTAGTTNRFYRITIPFIE